MKMRSIEMALLLLVTSSILLALGVTSTLAAELPPPDVASYTIEARYSPESHMITAHERAVYRNTTEVPIADLVLHLYLNAFRNESTLWMREAGLGHRGYQFDPAYPGWIRIDRMQLEDGTVLTVTPVDEDETLVRSVLPHAIAPGKALTVEVTFTAQLPKVFARTGWADGGEFVMAGQWFPKFGVWESGAWNAHPFHANNEFYADFGKYEVTVTLPKGWVVGATGTRARHPSDNGDGTVTHAFVAEHVIDFAWSASPHFHVLRNDQRGIRIELFYYPGNLTDAQRVMAATSVALERYEQWYGPYGRGLYPKLSIILVPRGAGGAGGMEYPTLFTVGALGSQGMPACVRLLEAETVHELAHQWFQSMVATNEAEEPWLDEGLTDYSTSRVMRDLEGGGLVTCGGWRLSYLALRRWEYVMMPETPMAGAAWRFGMEYSIATYSKPVVAFTTLERWQGESALLDFLRRYTDEYAFAHPSADDMRSVMRETLGPNVAAWFFDNLVNGTATLDAQVAHLDADGVKLARDGNLCVPVEVKFIYGGEAESIPWPCGTTVDRQAHTLEEVLIDPQQVALLDLNLSNNGAQREPAWSTWLSVLARTVALLQALFRGGGP